MHAALHTRHGGKVKLSYEWFSDLLVLQRNDTHWNEYITNDGRYVKLYNLESRTLPLSQKEYVTTGPMAKLPCGQSDHLKN